MWELFLLAVTREYIRLSDRLTAINTELDWTLHGLNPIGSYGVNLNIATSLSIVAEEIDVKKFWDLESLGISEMQSCMKYTQEFSDTNITKKNNRFEVSSPWKDINIRLHNNYNGALIRLSKLIARSMRDSRLYEYDNAVRDYMDSKCAEEAPVETSNLKTYYMPHHSAYRDDKITTKLRVVFDASAYEPGFLSLNEHLWSGGRVALIADVEKAFLQIGLVETDRDSYRFLRYDHLNSTKNMPQVKIFRMTRVTFVVTHFYLQLR